MKFVDPIAYNNHMSMLKHKKKTHKIPNQILKLIYDNNIIDIESEDKRAKEFLKMISNKNIRGSTVKKYYEYVKPLIFPSTKIEPNTRYFNKLAQTRLPCKNEYIINIIKLAKQNLNNKYNCAILMAYYTALRTSEIVQISVRDLIMLKNKQTPIPIIRKNNASWEVVYYEEFNLFILQLCEIYKKMIDFYNDNDINLRIFDMSTNSLHYNLKDLYVTANKIEPPYGFGIHAFRYYIATKLIKENSSNAYIVQKLLQHTNIKTTQRYIKYNYELLYEKLNEINTIDKNVLYKRIIENATIDIN